MLIRRKFALSSFGLILVTGLSGLLGLTYLSHVQTDVRQNNEDLIPHSTTAVAMAESLLTLHVQAHEVVRLALENHPLTNHNFFNPTLAELHGAISDAVKNIETVGLPLARQSGQAAEVDGENEELKTLAEFRDSCAVLEQDLLVLDVLARTNGVAAGAQLDRKIEPLIEKLLPEFRTYQDGIWNEMKDEGLQIEKSVRQTQATIVASTFGALALVTAMVWFISRSISKPILDLQQAVKRIGRGEREVKVDIFRRDEIGSLAHTFNEMTNDLRQTTVSKEYVDAVLRSMGDMLAVADRSGKIRSINRALLQVLGYEEGELVGTPFATLLTPSPVAVDTAFHKNLEDGRVHCFEAEFRKKDGAAVPVSISVSALRDTQNALNGCVWVAKDITARKAAEFELENVNKELLAVSRQAGMAEVATSVLHNVGNVLNSVNVSGSLIADKMRNSKSANVSKIVALMQAHEGDLGNFFANDPKGKQVPAYLASLASHLELERQNIMREAGSLVSNIAHIKEIVSMQQNYAKAFGVTELLKITDLVEDALRMNAGAMARHQITVVREFAEVPAIITDKHKILQILINLIRNAKYACDDSGRDDKQITLRVTNGEARTTISVIDNGIGIPSENLTCIFNHGFTTRKEGHGFGLHSGALAAKEMGGSLMVFSEGKGRGATFTLELPNKHQNQ